MYLDTMGFKKKNGLPGGGLIMDIKKKLPTLLIYIILSFIGLLMLVPFLWMLSTSLKTPGTEFFFPPRWIPDPVTFSNYYYAFLKVDLLLSYYNTIKVTVLTVVPMILLTSVAGYAFAKIRFSGRNVIFFICLMLIMIPQEITLVPNLLIMKGFGWLDTHLAIIVPNIFGSTAVFALFLMRQNFLTIPNEMVESGKIDGANQLRIFFKIMFPMAKAAVAAVVIFAAMNSWNDFIYPLVYLNSKENYTLQLALNMFKGTYGETEWTVWMAACTISVLPILLVYLFAQKQFIDSMVMTGIK